MSLLKNFHSALIFSLAIHLMFLVCIFVVEKNDEYLMVQKVKKHVEAIKKENPDAGSLLNPSEDEGDIYHYFIISIPATAGGFVLFRKLRKLPLC